MKERDLSLVVPLYNEEQTVFGVVSDLIEEFSGGAGSLELVLVENGSLDGTGTEIKRLREVYPEITHVRVERNQGYGLGVVRGLAAAVGQTVGFMGGDGQIAARDARRIWDVVRENPDSLVKARRIRRFDGSHRRWNSAIFNKLMRLCFGRISSDVNGTPKLFPRDWLPLLRLSSKDWFLDAEVLLKAAALGKRIVEVDVTFGKRSGGRSHVRLAAVAEFFRNMARYRFGGLASWKRGLSA